MSNIVESTNEKMFAIVGKFADQLLKKSKKNKMEASDVYALWNEIAPEYKQKQGEPIVAKCEHKFKDDNRCCTSKISNKSSTAKYCARHYSQHEKDPNATICDSIKKNGDRCSNVVSNKSTTGKYCSKHLAKEKDGVVNKKDFIKYISERVEEIDENEAFEDEMNSVLKKTANKFGSKSILNIEEIAPKIFKEHKSHIEKFQKTIKKEDSKDSKSKSGSSKKETSKSKSHKKKDDKKSDIAKFDAKKIKSGDLKGRLSVDIDGTTFVFSEDSTRKIECKLVKNKGVDLDYDDREVIKKYKDLSVASKKDEEEVEDECEDEECDEKHEEVEDECEDEECDEKHEEEEVEDECEDEENHVEEGEEIEEDEE